MEIPDRIWKATLDVSEVWAAMPVVQNYASVLLSSRTAGSERGGVAAHLRGTYAGLGALEPHALRQYSLLTMVRSQVPAVMPGMNWEHPELSAFMDRARSVEAAYVTTVQWIRSRIPGYPSIKVPQLAKGSPLRTEEFTWRTPWLVREYPGIQYSLRLPEEIGTMLGDLSRGKGLQDATGDLVNSLRTTDQWESYSDSFAQLTSTDRSMLTESVRECVIRLRSEAIDEHEPQNALRRNAYRSGVITEALANLTGGAATYANAFQDLDCMLKTILEDVFPQLVRGRPISRIRNPNRLVIDSDTVKWQESSFEIDIDAVGDLVLIEDPVLTEYAQVTFQNINFGRIDGELVDYEAQILDGALSGWGVSPTEGHSHR